MAGLSEDVLKKLISPNAKKLSSPEGDAMVNEGSFGNLDDFSDDMYLGATYEEPAKSTYKPINEAAIKTAKPKTNLLSSIQQDMVEHPVDTKALNTMMLESAGGGNPMNMEKLSGLIKGAKQVEQRLGGNVGGKANIQEQRGYGPGIDYALIKTIVNECLETKLSEMAQQGLLNEGATLKGIGLGNGKIKIVDNKGNVFSAKLEYQGNTKDKK